MGDAFVFVGVSVALLDNGIIRAALTTINRHFGVTDNSANGKSANPAEKAGPFAGFLYAQHGRHLYGESPEWGLASAYH